MIYIHTYNETDLTDDQLKGIFEILDDTWPEAKPKSMNWEMRKIDFFRRNPQKQCHLLFDDHKVIGYAESFARRVSTAEKHIDLMGIAQVCVSKEYRGRGLGLDLIKICFGRVSHGEFPVCLFQTGVPDFYRKENCILVHNKFVNSLDRNEPDKNPFWDDYTMVYPSTYNWPSGTIDILGPGF